MQENIITPIKGIASAWWSVPDSNAQHKLPHAVILPRQTHSIKVVEVKSADEDPGECDAIFTLSKGVAVGVQTADCVPVLLKSPDINAVAAIHAGWRGTLGKIAVRAIEALRDKGADPAQVIAAFGPSICGECYKIGAELAERFVDEGYGDAVTEANEIHRVDLQKVNIAQLLSAGLTNSNIHPCDICTLHSTDSNGLPSAPSWRRTPHLQERIITYILNE